MCCARLGGMFLRAALISTLTIPEIGTTKVGKVYLVPSAMYRVGVTWSGATTSTFFILMVDWKPPSARHIPEKRMCSGVKVVWGPGNPSNALGRSIGALGGTFGVDAVWGKAIQ